jgi:hypothetical protein
MKRLVFHSNPPCHLLECPVGFFVYKNELCFRTAGTTFYFNVETQLEETFSLVEAFNSKGEPFWGGATHHQAKERLTVTPMRAVWEDYEL